MLDGRILPHNNSSGHQWTAVNSRVASDQLYKVTTAMDVLESGIDFDNFQEQSVTTFKESVKVLSMSDIHGDSKANAGYLQQLHQPANHQDCFTIFICNGDICTDIPTLRKSFQILKSKFDEVCFVPGNHELWRKGTEQHGENCNTVPLALNSISKFNEVISCARQCGIRTGLHLWLYNCCITHNPYMGIYSNK